MLLEARRSGQERRGADERFTEIGVRVEFPTDEIGVRVACEIGVRVEFPSREIRL